jgi:hypothetical protein
MANPMRGEATFEALGETWTLRFNHNAICEFEDTAGVALASLAGSLKQPHSAVLLVNGCPYSD